MSKKTKIQSKSKRKTIPAKAETPEVAVSAQPGAPSIADVRLPPPGTLLQKLDRHGAVRCECTIGEDGIHYAGQTYRSLSAAAMAAAKALGLANKPSRPPKDPLQALERVWERYQGQVETIAKSAPDESRSLIATAIGKHSK